MPRDDRPPADAPRAPVAGGRDVPPPPVRAAGVLVVVQALAAVVFTVALAVRSATAQAGLGPVLGEAGFFLLLALAVGAVGAGLVAGRRGARTPALVTQLLLLPVVYALLSSRQLAIGVGCGVVVFAAFMLLVNERSRRWSMGGEPDPG